jgi:hypothetical protein
MQEQYQHECATTVICNATRAVEYCVAMPYVVPFNQGLEGQELVYTDKVNTLLNPVFCDVLPCNLYADAIKSLIIDAHSTGAISNDDVDDLIHQMENRSPAYKIANFVQQKVSELKMAEVLELLRVNIQDAEIALEQYGFMMAELDVGTIDKVEDEPNILDFSLNNTISEFIIDDTSLPLNIQTAIASVARLAGNLANISTLDHFNDYSEEMEYFLSLDNHIKHALRIVPIELGDSDYIDAILSIMPTQERNDYLAVLLDYYEYSVDDTDAHTDIRANITRGIGAISIDVQAHYQVNNYYPLRKLNKLKRRLARATKQYQNTRYHDLLITLSGIADVISQYATVSHYEYKMIGDCFSMSNCQVMLFRSHGREYADESIERIDTHIMETGEHLQMHIDTTDNECMKDFKNIQLGWLVIHCISTLLSEYQQHV